MLPNGLHQTKDAQGFKDPGLSKTGILEVF